jgi:hypothetical protein
MALCSSTHGQLVKMIVLVMLILIQAVLGGLAFEGDQMGPSSVVPTATYVDVGLDSQGKSCMQPMKFLAVA